MDYVLNPLAGFLVGVLVGMTGVGGGALMTPLLVLVFGIAPHTAVGTDLLFASATKSLGVWRHRAAGAIDWRVWRRLSAGSLPAALATVLWMEPGGTVREAAIVSILGGALLLTSAAMLARQSLYRLGKRLRTSVPAAFLAAQPPLTVAAGAGIGFLVALTSVGAGALGTVILVYLYPFRLTPRKLVGTDLAHAIPLALVAGLGHLAAGHVDFFLLALLLTGSIPGVLLGTAIAGRASEAFLRLAIAAVLGLVGLRMLAG